MVEERMFRAYNIQTLGLPVYGLVSTTLARVSGRRWPPRRIWGIWQSTGGKIQAQDCALVWFDLLARICNKTLHS